MFVSRVSGVTAGLSVMLGIQGAVLAAAPAPAVLVGNPTFEPDGVTMRVDTEVIARQSGPFIVEQFPLAAGATVDLELERFRVTGPGTGFVVGADQMPYDFDPDRVTLLRGKVAGEAGSHVFMAISPWGSIGRIERDVADGRYFLSGEGSTLRVRRGGENAIAAHPGSLSPDVPLCRMIVPKGVTPRVPVASPAGGIVPEVTQELEIALETDYELFLLFDDLDATCAYMVELWGAVSDIYLRDVNTRIKVTFIRLWDEPDLIFDAEDPFGDFVNHWEEFMGGVERDAAQFISGRRNLPYGGIAYVEALCDFAYGLTGYIIGFFDGLDVPSVFGYDVHVAAHELGHNCASFHTPSYGIDNCDDLFGVAERSTIMSYCSQTRSGGNANTDLRLHALVQDVMEQHIFSVNCIVDDCNGNGVDDADDIANGDSDDVNGNGVADECEDCNDNGTLDDEDISGGGSLDLNANGVPDECEPDCNGNNIPDDLDIDQGTDTDAYGNNIPDGCEVDCNGNGTSDYTDIQADMSLDIDRNAILDSCQDCDGDEIPDLVALGSAHNVWVASSVNDKGLFEFHAVSGVRSNLGAPGVLGNSQDVLITPTGRILVTSAIDDRVVEFDVTGAYVGDLVTAGAGGLDAPSMMAITPGGDLLVVSRDTVSVLAYNLTTGDPLGEFVASGLGGIVMPWGIVFGPDGALFVTSDDGRIIEYDGGTGALVGDFVTAGDNGGLTDPHGMLFKPDGNLLVASRGSNQILEYDGTTGAFIDQWNHGGTASVLTLDDPWTLRLGPIDGHVYASRYLVNAAGPAGGGHGDNDDIAELHVNSTRIYIFDINNGNFVRSYVTGHDTALSFPTGFDFYPSLGTDCNANTVPDACDIASGASEDANGNGVPDECEELPDCADLDGDGSVSTGDLLTLLSAWGSDPGGPPDYDGDGNVATSDLLFLLGAWGPCP